MESAIIRWLPYFREFWAKFVVDYSTLALCSIGSTAKYQPKPEPDALFHSAATDESLKHVEIAWGKSAFSLTTNPVPCVWSLG